MIRKRARLPGRRSPPPGHTLYSLSPMCVVEVWGWWWVHAESVCAAKSARVLVCSRRRCLASRARRRTVFDRFWAFWSALGALLGLLGYFWGRGGALGAYPCLAYSLLLCCFYCYYVHQLVACSPPVRSAVDVRPRLFGRVSRRSQGL